MSFFHPLSRVSRKNRMGQLKVVSSLSCFCPDCHLLSPPPSCPGIASPAGSWGFPVEMVVGQEEELLRGCKEGTKAPSEDRRWNRQVQRSWGPHGEESVPQDPLRQQAQAVSASVLRSVYSDVHPIPYSPLDKVSIYITSYDKNKFISLGHFELLLKNIAFFFPFHFFNVPHSLTVWTWQERDLIFILKRLILGDFGA